MSSGAWHTLEILSSPGRIGCTLWKFCQAASGKMDMGEFGSGQMSVFVVEDGEAILLYNNYWRRFNEDEEDGREEAYLLSAQTNLSGTVDNQWEGGS